MKSMARMRLGVVLLLPVPVAQEVDGLRRALGDRSLSRAPAHLTLMPPVNVRLDELGKALAMLRAGAAAAPRRLTLTLGAPTTFLPVNPVLYLPVGGEIDAVAALRSRLLAPPLARPLAWPFVPHVTIADNVSTDRLAAAVEALADYRAEVAIERVHLLEEVRGAGAQTDPLPDGPRIRRGPRWQPLADVAFGPPAIVARAGPLALELVRSQMLDPEAAALVSEEGIERSSYRYSERTLVITARREGGVVGVAVAWSTPDGCRSGVLVAAVHRRQGIGRHLEAALTSALNETDWGSPSTQPVDPLECSKSTESTDE